MIHLQELDMWTTNIILAINNMISAFDVDLENVPFVFHQSGLQRVVLLTMPHLVWGIYIIALVPYLQIPILIVQSIG